MHNRRTLATNLDTLVSRGRYLSLVHRPVMSLHSENLRVGYYRLRPARPKRFHLRKHRLEGLVHMVYLRWLEGRTGP